jgi:hypothetical protein
LDFDRMIMACTAPIKRASALIASQASVRS